MSDDPPAASESPGPDETGQSRHAHPPDSERLLPAEGSRHPDADTSRGGSTWAGIIIALLVTLALWLVPNVIEVDKYQQLGLLLLLSLIGTLCLVPAGVVLVALPRTRRTGAGLLMGFGAAILISGGICANLSMVR